MRTKRPIIFPEIAAAVLLVIVLATAGCTAVNNPNQADDPEADSPSGLVEVTDADNGATIEVQLGQELTITLDSNPTTGFSWQLSELENDVLSQVGEVEYFSQAEENMVGAGGVEVFRFSADQVGTVTLQLAYQRPWEEGVAPEKEFSLTVVVSD